MIFDENLNNHSGIYCIENIVNNKKYIGMANRLKARKTCHVYNLNKQKHRNIHLQGAWNKYGSDNFIFYVLEECDKECLDDREKYWMEYYDSRNQDFGYNLKAGGGHGKHSDETKEKMSKTRKGRVMPEEQRKRQSEAMKGMVFSQEHKDNIKKNHFNQSGIKHPSFGKKRTTTNSEYIGLGFHQGKWQVTLRENGKQKYVGLYGDKIEAAKAFDKYVVEHGLEYPLNFPEDYEDKK